MLAKKFQRTKEDFTCTRCGIFVCGDGYTNHCPGCLWSRHVDINPGDRMADCGGLMEPVGLEIRNGETTILHRCADCGYERRNRISPDDDPKSLFNICLLGPFGSRSRRKRRRATRRGGAHGEES